MLFSDSKKIWKKKPNTDKSTTAGQDGQKQTDCKYHSYEKIPVLPKSRDQKSDAFQQCLVNVLSLKKRKNKLKATHLTVLL